MIGQDDSEAANILRGGGGGGNSKPMVDDNVIYNNNNSNTNNTNVTQTWRAKNVLDQSSLGSNSISKNNDNGSAELFTGSSRATNHNQQQYFVEPSELTNRIYIDDSGFKMGNRQQGQYQINNVGGKQAAESAPLRVQVGHKEQGLRKNDANNSHLIVDLTTPRVLAKTQTNLSQAAGNNSTAANITSQQNSDLQHNRDSWSLNQVGLPQPIASTTNNSQQASSGSSSAAAKKQTAFLDSSSSNQAINLNYSDQDELSSLSQLKEQKAICTAPYYYSDLKSEEQRNALLNIVQQKSLSPPPQLLSRSTDQSSTRLGPKSATLHSSRAHLLNENLPQMSNQKSQEFAGSRRKQSVMRVEQHSVADLSKMVELSEVKRKPDEMLVSLSTRHLQQSSARELRRCASLQMDLAMNLNSSSSHSPSVSPNPNPNPDPEPEEKGMNIKMSGKNLHMDSSYSQSARMSAASKERVKGSSSSSLESDGSGSRSDGCGGSASSSCASPNGKLDGLAGGPAAAAADCDVESAIEEQGLLSEANVDVDEDFIEFLTNGDTKSGPHSAQFDASQFSASDFNSSSSNSESSSTQSNAPTNDSLSSPLIGSNQAKHLFTNGGGQASKANGKTHNIGILKLHSQANNNNGCSRSKSNGGSSNNSSASNANSKSNGNCNNNNLTNDIACNKSDENGKRKFNNVLGNVIDVDIYPINNASRCSPVNNQA